MFSRTTPSQTDLDAMLSCVHKCSIADMMLSSLTPVRRNLITVVATARQIMHFAVLVPPVPKLLHLDCLNESGNERTLIIRFRRFVWYPSFIHNSISVQKSFTFSSITMKNVVFKFCKQSILQNFNLTKYHLRLVW